MWGLTAANLLAALNPNKQFDGTAKRVRVCERERESERTLLFALPIWMLSPTL